MALERYVYDFIAGLIGAFLWHGVACPLLSVNTVRPFCMLLKSFLQFSAPLFNPGMKLDCRFFADGLDVDFGFIDLTYDISVVVPFSFSDGEAGQCSLRFSHLGAFDSGDVSGDI